MPLSDYIARAEDIVTTSKNRKQHHGGPPLSHQIFISTEDPAVIDEARAYRRHWKIMACNETRNNGRIQVLLKSGIERVLMDLLNLGTCIYSRAVGSLALTDISLSPDHPTTRPPTTAPRPARSRTILTHPPTIPPPHQPTTHPMKSSRSAVVVLLTPMVRLIHLINLLPRKPVNLLHPPAILSTHAPLHSARPSPLLTPPDAPLTREQLVADDRRAALNRHSAGERAVPRRALAQKCGHTTRLLWEAEQGVPSENVGLILTARRN